MKTTENTTAQTQEEIIAELKAKLEKAKEEANGCKTSTLSKVGKVGLGLLVVGAAAVGGYYLGSQEANETTTIINN